MEGTGERARIFERLFAMQCKRLGLSTRTDEDSATQRHPSQRLLFGAP
jgi:hypothetical protein